MLRFMIGEIAVCVFVVGVLATVLTALYGVGCLLRAFTVMTTELLRERSVSLSVAAPSSRTNLGAPVGAHFLKAA